MSIIRRAAFLCCSLAIYAGLSASVAPAETQSPQLAQALEQAGGRDSVMAAKQVRLNGRFEIEREAQGPISGSHETLIEFPARLRQVRTFSGEDGGGRLMRILDQDQGEVQTPSGASALSQPMVTELQAYLRQRYLSILHAIATDRVEVTGPQKLETGAQDGIVLLPVSIDGFPMTLGIDTEVRRLVSVRGPMGDPAAEGDDKYLQVFDDFQRKSGIDLPMQTRSYVSGQENSRREEHSVEINPLLSEGFQLTPRKSKPQ